MTLLLLENVTKQFRGPDGAVQPVIDVPRFELARGEQVALEGRSGTGKTTLLHLIAGILRADGGRIMLDGEDLTRASEARRDRVRAEKLGYVFQTFNLLQGYSALENVMLGMSFGRGVDKPHAEELLRRLGLADRLHHRPAQLSIGQQQRVALARAVANRPRLVLADEPTGNLDPFHANEALELLRTLCQENETALLLVSHDRDVLGRFEKRVALETLNRASRPAHAAAGARA
ncbi:MAG: ABC transporter ATP-binding protein [Planctomycetes bacterium]|nr:ABC transporter ATP-binding protein [Planctomycetota bacterium]